MYKVSFGNDNTMPSCSCEDWRASAYPCKHFFAIIQKYPDDWPWEALSSLYRCSPFLTLDSFAASDHATDNDQSTIDGSSFSSFYFAFKFKNDHL